MPVELPFPLTEAAGLGERIRFHRRRLGLTQATLASRADIQQAYLSQIERGRRQPSGPLLFSLAEALQIPPGVLIGDGTAHDQPQPVVTREVPLLGSIPAGPPAASQEQPDVFPVLRHLWAPDRYCLRLTFDSMEPTLKPGDIVLVHYRPDVNPELVQGRVCACLIDGQPTLKRVFVGARDGERIVMLRGDNPSTPLIELGPDADFSIQGVALALVSREL
jgi:SOS-response transcriptional repressor LexA